MNRRAFVLTTASAGVTACARPKSGGRLKQSVSKWCFDKWWSLDQLCRNAAELGLAGVDLATPEDWPTIRKYGLVPTMQDPGGGTITDGLNRKENHAAIERQLREGIARCAAAGVPNIITFSGSRGGLSDSEGIDNSVLCLNRIKEFAEDKGVTVCLELLNSKVDHPDYQCDHTAWGVEVCKRVNSPRVKLLYDIYHMQIMEGDIIRTLREAIPYIAHIHTGGNPGRHEIDATQELNYRAIAGALADLEFSGFVAHEFLPVGDPLASLRQAIEICSV